MSNDMLEHVMRHVNLARATMAKQITRRDLLNGVAVGVVGAVGFSGAMGAVTRAHAGAPATGLAAGSAAAAAGSATGPGTHYPPTLTGMRGSHAGSYEVAHALAWRGEKPGDYATLDEEYDLVVVGGGMSGLAAAWYYYQHKGASARILVLDNHDDFGGHAKRNEFHHGGRMVLSLAGAQNLENPGDYSAPGAGLLADIGIDSDAFDAMDANTPDNFTLGGKLHGDVGMTIPSSDGHRTLGGHWLKFMHGRGDYAAAVSALPFAEDEKSKLIGFFGGERDYLDDLSLSEKYDYVNSVSYNQFLVERVGLSEDTIPLMNAHLRILNGPSGWSHTVAEAIASAAPGLRAMGWLANAAESVAAMFVDDVTEIRMFPDGNASIARLLVKKLVPAVAPDMQGFADVAVARFDYAALDQEDQPTRIRLNSTVVGVRENARDGVDVDYVQHGRAVRVRARHCILACYNGIIPHLCPQMSEPQKAGLAYGVKVPFVYANVLLRNSRAFTKLGVTITQCPYDPFQWVSAAPTMSTGGYEPPRDPEDPMVVFMMASPTPATKEDATARDLLRVGRQEIYSTSFEQYEQQIREQLQGMLGQHGFDHETDIQAITVNRIPHGYAYSYLGLDDPEWEEKQAPHEIGRAQFGRISIANSDSEARAYMDAAFDAAWRAVQEQTGLGS